MAVGDRNIHIVFIAAVFCLCLLCGCDGYRRADKITDYELFLHNYTKYSDIYLPPDAPVGPGAENIEGFTALSEIGFEFGKSFGGGVAFVKTKSGKYLLNARGELKETKLDLSETQTYGTYYIAEENGLKGVRTVFGDEILPCAYSEIRIIGKTVLAENAERYEIYSCGVLTCAVPARENVSLISENYILAGDTLRDLYYNAQYACGRKYAAVPSEGKVTVELESGYVGYADIENMRLIGGEYAEASGFCEGTATARKPSGEWVVIDSLGNELFSSKAVKAGNSANGYRLYLKYNFYGAMDGEFNDITGAIFHTLRYEYVTGDCVIPRYGKGYAVYSLAERRYTGVEHEQIDYADGLFICRDGEKTIVRNGALKIIAECESAEMSENVLTIRKDGKYFYYIKS